MTLLFVILVVIASVILGFIILVQNPKGGGLTGNVAGLGNQFMGVKQTTDVLEKGTWLFAGILGLLCIVSSLFMAGSMEDSSPINRLNPTGAPVKSQPAVPANSQPASSPTNATPATTTPPAK